jgi:hypothetical protein
MAAAGQRAGSAGSTGYARVRARHRARADSHGARAVCGLGRGPRGAWLPQEGAHGSMGRWYGVYDAARARRATLRRGARRPARTYFIIPLFGRANLQIFE